MHRVLKGFLVLAAVASVMAPKVARADTFVTLWGSEQTGTSWGQNRPAFGINLGFLSGGLIGVEIVGGYSKDTLGSGSGVDLIDGMANVLLAPSLPTSAGTSIRPYGTAGLGLEHFSAGNAFGSISNSDGGWNAGGGIIIDLAEHIGVRGDIRYYGDFHHTDTHYWRVAGGLVLR